MYGIIMIITLNCIFYYVEPNKLASRSISRDCGRRMEKANTPSDSQENGESKDVKSHFFQNSEIATFSHPGSHILNFFFEV